MVDWTKSMQQTFEYYVVDPYTWSDVRRVDKVKSCSITRDLGVQTLGSASLDCDEDLNDKYVRVYLIARQGDEIEKVPLGTHLYQSPSTSFDGKRQSINHDGYTPLIEMTEKQMPVGFTGREEQNVLDLAYQILTDGSLRAPVIRGSDTTTLTGDFLADISESRLSFVSDLLILAKYSLGLDELGKIIFSPDRKLDSMQPVWSFTDDNSSILYPDLTMTRDIFGIPNRIEVIYSPNEGSPMTSVLENTDDASIVSRQARGRWITYRETDPNVASGIAQWQLDAYTRKRLEDLSTVDFEVSYRHAYCPVRLGDCVRLNYVKAGLSNTRAKVIKQDIECVPGCPVRETAVFTKKLWG